MKQVVIKYSGTRLVCDPAYIVGRITLVSLGLGEIILGSVSSGEARALFLA